MSCGISIRGTLWHSRLACFSAEQNEVIMNSISIFFHSSFWVSTGVFVLLWYHNFIKMWYQYKSTSIFYKRIWIDRPTSTLCLDLTMHLLIYKNIKVEQAQRKKIKKKEYIIIIYANAKLWGTCTGKAKQENMLSYNSKSKPKPKRKRV